MRDYDQKHLLIQHARLSSRPVYLPSPEARTTFMNHSDSDRSGGSLQTTHFMTPSLPKTTLKASFPLA